jgi:hypothetical protein
MYSYLKKTKNVIFFSFTKLENRRVEQVLSGGWYVGGERCGERVQEVNMVEI